MKGVQVEGAAGRIGTCRRPVTVVGPRGLIPLRFVSATERSLFRYSPMHGMKMAPVCRSATTMPPLCSTAAA